MKPTTYLSLVGWPLRKQPISFDHAQLAGIIQNRYTLQTTIVSVAQVAAYEIVLAFLAAVFKFGRFRRNLSTSFLS